MSTLDYVKNRTVLVTGAAGTIGSALSRTLLPAVRSLRAYDHSESDLFHLHERLRGKGSLSPQLGDIRDLDRLRFAMNGVQVVFHTAALKHVGLGEYNPFEVVQSNLVGLNNVIRAALDASVERIIFTSSDKAVNPTNVMGASKMMGERLITAANEVRGDRDCRFGSVRFGNVIGSRGSVVPIFAEQLMRGEPLTLTDDAMTRYVMAIDEAAQLVIEAGARMRGGEVFVAKMRALKITDLGIAMAHLLDKKEPTFVRTGCRPGEKLYEELISAEEQDRTLDLGRLLVTLPAPETVFPGRPTRESYPEGGRVTKDWNSSNDTLMTVPQIADYFRTHGVIDALKWGPR